MGVILWIFMPSAPVTALPLKCVSLAFELKYRWKDWGGRRFVKEVKNKWKWCYREISKITGYGQSTPFQLHHQLNYEHTRPPAAGIRTVWQTYWPEDNTQLSKNTCKFLDSFLKKLGGKPWYFTTVHNLALSHLCMGCATWRCNQCLLLMIPLRAH